jgi:hypothetical protein
MSDFLKSPEFVVINDHRSPAPTILDHDLLAALYALK